MSINLYFCNPVRLKEPVIVKVMTTKTQQIRIEDFDYPLPDERIAKFPLPKRDESKLLLYKEGKVSESIFKHITDYLPEGSLMVFNNTRVIQARLLFQKETGAKIEIFCLEPVEPHDYALVFQQTECCRWTCLVGNLKKWKEGLLKKEVQLDGETVILKAEKLQTCGDSYLIEFTWDHPTCTFADLLDAAGVLPIPPYLNRETEKSDLQTYQTVYSKIKGSVAAPTAGLHFTPEVLAAAKDCALQVAAMNPQYISRNDISAEELAKIKEITIDSALNDATTLPKPILNKLLDKAIGEKVWSDEDINNFEEHKSNMNYVWNFLSDAAKVQLGELAMADKASITAEKMFGGLVEGRVSKQLKEICLLDQTYVKAEDGKQSVAKYLESVSKNFKITKMIRFEVGEGMEKKQEDFAAEVAAQMNA